MQAPCNAPSLNGGDALTVEALRAAHLKQESGRVIGKQVLGGF